MSTSILEAATSIAESDFEGWVAWVDGVPIFERTPRNPRLAPLVRGGIEQPVRFDARNALDWKDVPNQRIQRLELYFARQAFRGQPALRLDREPGMELHWIQMKLGGLVWGPTQQVSRLGVTGYRLGYWAPRLDRCEVWEVLRTGETTKLPVVRDPRLPKPEGLGLAPSVMGLTA